MTKKTETGNFAPPGLRHALPLEFSEARAGMNGWTAIRALSRMCSTLEQLAPLSAADVQEIRQYEAQGLPVWIELCYYVTRCNRYWPGLLRWYLDEFAVKSRYRVVFEAPEEGCGHLHRFRLLLSVTSGQVEKLLSSRSLRWYSALCAVAGLVEVEDRSVLLVEVPQIRDLIAEEEGEP